MKTNLFIAGITILAVLCIGCSNGSTAEEKAGPAGTPTSTSASKPDESAMAKGKEDVPTPLQGANSPGNETPADTAK